jgi:nitrogen fixation-related uncharacterized protein
MITIFVSFVITYTILWMIGESRRQDEDRASHNNS